MFLSAALAFGVVSRILAGVTPVGNSFSGPIFRAEVPFANFDRTNGPQEQPQWCWAASISNVFRYYGYNVSQGTIVQAVFGREVNLPAFSARQIAALLNREWTDAEGKRFRSILTAAYDPVAGVAAMNNAIIIDNLKNERPLVICNAHHCMVLTAIDFTPMAVIAGSVFDPWPYGPAAHALPPGELIPAHIGGQLMFLAAVRVERISGSSSSPVPAAAKPNEIVGDWSGNLQTPWGRLFLVFHISEQDGRLSATSDSPAQQAFGIPVSTVSYSNKTLRYSILPYGATFTGQLSGDVISGMFTQNGMGLPLTLARY